MTEESEREDLVSFTKKLKEMDLHDLLVINALCSIELLTRYIKEEQE